MNSSPRSNRSRRSARIRVKWQQHITAQQASGLTQTAYCREQGLNRKYFSLWKSKLAKPETAGSTATSETAKPELIPVILKTEVIPATESAKSVPTALPCVAQSNDVVLKARLPNGIALEFLFHSARALSPLLIELAQLPC
jgi:hypothetical protein